jgi:hypothetical protein
MPLSNYRFGNATNFVALIALIVFALWTPVVAQAQDAGSTAPAPAATSPAPTDQSAPQAAQAPAPQQPGAPVSSTSTMTGQSTASPAPSSSRHFWIGPEVGVFFPGGKLSSRFGSSWFSIGLGLGQIRQASRSGQLGLDFNLLSRIGSSTHAYIAPIGLQYRVALAQGGYTIPYVGVSGDLVLADIRSPQDNAHSGLMETGGGSVYVGTSLGPQAYVEARYLALGSVQGFNLSGLNLSAGLRF